MKKLLLCQLFLVLSLTTNAQNTFEKVIDTLGCGNASCIQETYDGGYVFCGSTIYNDAIIVKLDSLGIIEWAKVYGGAGLDGANYLEQTLDSGFIVSADYDVGLFTQNWLLRLDVNGDTIWTKKYSIGSGATNGSQSGSMAIIADTLYGQTGYYETHPSDTISAYFISSLSTGVWLGHKLYNYSPFQTLGYAIDKTFNGGFIISAYYATSFSNTDFYLINVDINGDTLWTRTYNYSKNDAGLSIKQTTDSGFIVAGYTFNSSTVKYNIFMFRTNSDGDTLWTMLYSDSLEQSANSVNLTNDNGYIIAATATNSALNYDLLLIKTDANGDTLWRRWFGGGLNDIAFYTQQTIDNGYIMSGLYRSPGGGGAYIIKTDSLGNVPSATGVAELNNPFGLDVFPNPTAGLFTIKTNGIPEKNILLNVLNVSNQCVYQCTMKNNSTVQIDLRSFINGIYVLMLTTSKNRYSKKIIIQKFE